MIYYYLVFFLSILEKVSEQETYIYTLDDACFYDTRKTSFI